MPQLSQLICIGAGMVFIGFAYLFVRGLQHVADTINEAVCEDEANDHEIR